VSTAPEFQQIVESKHDNVLGEDRTLIFDQQGIDNPNQTVYGLKENTTYYWRVKVHVTDKRSDWSETFKFTTGDVIISVDDFETSASSDLMIMPSIVENGQEYKIALKSYRNENVLINIYDQLGNVVYAENEQVGSGNILNLRCPESLSSGLYYVVVKSDKKNLLGKLIVN
jgi:PDZ domain-containing secreted protein